jgi:hypothetical protein
MIYVDNIHSPLLTKRETYVVLKIMSWRPKYLAIAALFAVFSFLWGAKFTLGQTAGALLKTPNQVVVQGNYAYVVSEGGDDALEIIDISNPAFPAHKGSITKDENGNKLFFDPKSVAVQGNYAYVANFFANSLEIIDVSDLANPTHLSTLRNGDGSAQLIRPVFIRIVGNYAYLAVRGSQNIAIIDIADPSNQVSVSTIPSSGWFASPTSLFVSGNYLYFTEEYAGGGTFKIYDISDPYAPIPQGVIFHGTDGASIDNPTDVFVLGDHAYVTSYGGRSLEIIDVSDPVFPTHVGVIYDGDGGANLFVPNSVKVVGDFAYITTLHGSGLEIVDVSDPANPIHKGKIDDGDGGAILLGSTSVDVSGSYAYVTSSPGNALEIVDISDPANPVHKGKLLNGEIGGPPAPEGCTVDCHSNVLFLPGIKGSVLKMGNDTLWFPSFLGNDVKELALNSSGESVNDVYVEGILKTASAFGISASIYGPFSDFMDGLVSSETVEEWLPLAYDWRFSPEEILKDGIKTKDGVIEVKERVEELAANSRTGKVAIVAHSMGGFLGKAIIKELEEAGKADLIDSFTMIGTPQLGTPQAVGVLLHGGSERIPFIVNPIDIREIAQNMPSAFDLLPSRRYFEEVLDPVITIDPKASFADEWRALWGGSINNYDDYLEFLTGAGAPRVKPPVTRLNIPEVLSESFMDNADNFHIAYDNYQFPEEIRVIEVAGWGVPTVKGIKYTMNHGIQSYEILPTLEGDSTVVYKSSVTQDADESFFFDLFEFRKTTGGGTQHRNLLNSLPIQNLLTQVIKKESIRENFISEEKPLTDNLTDQLIVSTKSPVFLGAHDQFGNFTGIDPNQDISLGSFFTQEGIPGSTFIYTADSQYIFLPKSGTYNFSYKGIGTGPTTVEVSNFQGDTVAPVASFIDMPTYSGTVASFTVESNRPEDTVIHLDLEGDGQVDKRVTKGAYEFSGFLQPINDTNIFPAQKPSVFKAGSTVPVKFKLKKWDGATAQVGALPEWLIPQRGSKMDASVDESMYGSAGSTGNTYKWDPESEQYIYNWSTKGLAGGYWYEIFAKLDDGNTYSIIVGLK